MAYPSTSERTQDTSPHESELFMLAGLGAIIRWLEELASLLSGPVLTFGLGIALIDLLTDGRLLASMPALLFAWAASQAVGLDAQLVGSSAKLAAALRRRRWWAVIGFTFLVIALGAVAYQASAVFAIQQADGISTQAALTRLGMDTATWLLERSALAVFLVVLSGLLRYVAPAKARIGLADEQAELERQLTLEPLRQRLRAQQVGGWRAVAETALRGQPVPMPETANQTANMSPNIQPDTPSTEPPDDLPPDDAERPSHNGHHHAEQAGGTTGLLYMPPVQAGSRRTAQNVKRDKTSGQRRDKTSAGARDDARDKARRKGSPKRLTMAAYERLWASHVEDVRRRLDSGEQVTPYRVKVDYHVSGTTASRILARAQQRTAQPQAV